MGKQLGGCGGGTLVEVVGFSLGNRKIFNCLNDGERSQWRQRLNQEREGGNQWREGSGWPETEYLEPAALAVENLLPQHPPTSP